MTRRPIAVVVAAVCLAALATPSLARHPGEVGNQYESISPSKSVRAVKVKRQARPSARSRSLPGKARNAGVTGDRRVRRVERQEPVQPWGASESPRVVAHPAGCPSRAFCGCGVALDVFGRHVRELWLARNWFRFPRANPAPGMVAVRRHHVFKILAVKGHGLVLAYDPNSGGRKTRIHVRSLAGYAVVDPHGRRYAAAQ